ncbi:tyrosine-type recombinase/integrase [Tunturiibacter lichenicola]|uniref:tyrosine-type recombinase/integrase n=1 Tax=Tunturiibacter lichenicola TaxID=2051959 RepID=UPI003D9AC490
MQTNVPAVPGGLAPSCESVRSLIASGVIPPIVANYITTLEARCLENEIDKKEVPRRGKSMSRRTGQNGHVEKSGNWWVVRWWEDVPGQAKRVHRRAKICPVTGLGKLSESARRRRAREIIAASGSDTQEHFDRVVKMQPAGCVTFSEQSKIWFANLIVRRRDPVAPATIETWEATLRKHLIPLIGDIPLCDVNNSVLKQVVGALVDKGLKPGSIHNYSQIPKMVMASAVDEEGQPLYPRKWNHHFMDLPRVIPKDQNRPTYTPEQITFMARWPHERERMLFVFLAGSGVRIGEALGLEIDKHISANFRTITIEQKVRRGKVEERVKTAHAERQVDLHPSIAQELSRFVGCRTNGFLFQTKDGRPLLASSLYSMHLQPALRQLGFVNEQTGTTRAGFHAFRRFRTTHLRNRQPCPPGLVQYWMGHAPQTMDDFYDLVRRDEALRREWAEKCGFGFELPSGVPIVPKTDLGEME